MTIDTAEKRKSAASVGHVSTMPSVTPNASADSEWRQQSAWSYSGIDVDVDVPAAGNPFYRPLATSVSSTRRLSPAQSDTMRSRPSVSDTRRIAPPQETM